jgi:hypothetical protein
MKTQAQDEEILWMADCYNLAKHFHDPAAWMSLLEPLMQKASVSLRPFHYWLWMEIWKAAQSESECSGEVQASIT